ncbi:MAG: MarR family transcriptional regulator [Alphaproteobacteria bacterium]|nr:MarR family transcriptional regulator [Alphaproteobacteria bacterium]
MADRRSARRRRAVARGVPHGVLDGLLGYHLRRAQFAVFQDFAATMRGMGITPGQFGVLALIQANPGLTQSALGEAMGVDRSTVVAVIDRLESRGLVRRAPSPNDRRSYALILDDEGVRRFAAALKRVRVHERRIARRLTAAERATLVELLRRVG